MKNKILILAFAFFVELISAQQPVPNSNSGKGASPLSTINIQLTTSSTYAVVVGISDYQDPAIPDLRFADKDAEAFANYLRSIVGGKLDVDHLKVLINQQATMAQFAIQLDWLLENAKENDRVIIYFSGHGDVEKKTLTQPGFLLCWDAPAQVYMSGGAFALPMLQEVISTLSIQNKAKVIVITDACRSGTLAGSSVGGAQATASNLAKQYANEIKIMSCQPNEYSIEGEQWGGGRGAFSFHLIDALYGMADNNDDQSVTLYEVGRYLEDHVTNEVAPISQLPIVLGNRNERLTNVDASLLASLRSGKTNQMAMLTSIESRGIEDIVFAGADTTIKELYQLFKKALNSKTFLEPINACADSYYEQLVKEPKLERLHSTMKRNYAAALQDDAQQAVNNILNMEKTEVRLYRLELIKKYSPYPHYLERAADLLGSKHYLYPTLRARSCYFEAQVLQMESPLNPDSLLGQRLINKYRESLKWLPDFPTVYYQMSYVFRTVIPNVDSALAYAYKAIDLSPNWIFVINNTATYIGRTLKNNKAAKKLFAKSLAIDSTRAETWTALAAYYFDLNHLDSSENCLQKSLSFDNSYNLTYFWLGVLEFNGRNNQINSEKHFIKAAQVDKPGPDIFNYLGCIHYNLKDFEQAEMYYKKGLEIEPEHNFCNIYLADIYFRTQRSDEAKKLIQRVLHYDSMAYFTLVNIARMFIENKYLKEAEYLVRKVISLDSMNAKTYDYWAGIYDLFKQHPEAEQLYKKSIQLDSTRAYIHEGLADLYASMSRFIESEFQYKKAIQIDSNYIHAYCNLGWLYASLNQFEEAELQVKKAIQMDTAFNYAYYTLACFRSLHNQLDEAFQYLEQALKTGWNDYDWTQNDKDLLHLRDRKEQWHALMKKYFPEKMK